MKKYVWLFVLALVAVACNNEESGEEPIIIKEFLEVKSNLQLSGEGQEIELEIKANCDWTISKAEEWMTVSPMSGSNTQRVNISVTRNMTAAERTAILRVKGRTVPERTVIVTQAVSTAPKEPNADDNLPPS